MNSTTPDLIAPCGLNCCLCKAHIRKKNACPGCRADDALKPKTRVICKIKTCEKMASGNISYCFDCEKFPCPNLAHLDKRYQTKYAASPIGNLVSIKDIGITKFIANEDKKWACPECGVLLCMHEPRCLVCGYIWRD